MSSSVEGENIRSPVSVSAASSESKHKPQLFVTRGTEDFLFYSDSHEDGGSG